MAVVWIHLAIMLFVILLASMLFTNALEHFGHKLGLSAGVVGSVFAAIATALPETSIPIIAIFAGSSDKVMNHEVGVGAILGAPFMLGTLSIFLVAVFAMKTRGVCGKIQPENKGFTRDLNYFLGAFSLAALAMFVPVDPWYFRGTIGAVLVLIYIVYMISTCKASSQLVMDGHGVIPDEPLYLARLCMRDTTFTVFLQVVIAAALLFFGARGFISAVESISHSLQISALLLSLLIIPIATELPEKVNSILWIRQNKDTLSVGNITGAMVFQGTLLPAMGIMLTPWMPGKNVVIGILLTLIAALWLRFHAKKEGMSLKILFVNGGLYVLFLCLVLI